jgi:polysaccharide biosynthesis protein PslG
MTRMPSQRLRTAALLAALAMSTGAAVADGQGVERKTLEFTILEDYDKGESLHEVARDFALFRRLGIRAWRGSLGWDDYEPVRGQYDFAWLHRFARLAADSGITLRPYLGYTPEWAAAGRKADGHTWNDPPDSTAWPRFVRAVVGELRGHPNVRSYELYNEVNTRLWWDGTVEEYAQAFRLGARAVRAANPRAQVIAAGLVWPDAPWMATVCESAGGRGSVDAVAVHSYHETWTPGAETVETFGGPSWRSGFLSTLDEACGSTPVWVNEAGFATANGHTERDQALWWARAVATYAATPRVTQIGVYEIKDLRSNDPIIGEAENRHLGISDTARRPKTAFFTVQRLVSLLAGQITVLDAELRVVERSSVDSLHGGTTPDSGHAIVHAFGRPDGRQVVIAWVPKGVSARRVTITLPRAGRRATAYSLDGHGTPLDGRPVAFDERPTPFDARTGRRLELTLPRDQVALVVVAP